MSNRDSERAESSAAVTHGVGKMPPTDEIPEPPTHRLVIAGEERTVRYVNGGYFDHGTIHRKHTYLIVRCGVCGHDSDDWGTMRQHAWNSHEMHFSTTHVGKKVVWRREDLPDEETALTTAHPFRESRWNEDDNEWDNYLFKARGDCPDEDAVDIARDKLDDPDAELVIEHWPPAQAYPGSIEEDAQRELRPAPDNETGAEA